MYVLCHLSVKSVSIGCHSLINVHCLAMCDIVCRVSIFSVVLRLHESAVIFIRWLMWLLWRLSVLLVLPSVLCSLCLAHSFHTVRLSYMW